MSEAEGTGNPRGQLTQASELLLSPDCPAAQGRDRYHSRAADDEGNGDGQAQIRDRQTTVDKTAKSAGPLHRSDSSPEVIRLVLMMYVRFTTRFSLN